MLHTITPGCWPVVIAVTVTDRSRSFKRLLDSLAPVKQDPNLHLMVLDNCTNVSESQTLWSQCLQWERTIAGTVHAWPSPTPGAPIHITRAALTEHVFKNVSGETLPPIVWVIDDDLTFDKLTHQGDVLRLENVACDHLQTIRTWRQGKEAPYTDVIIGDVTGDPPIRPEAVLATQLADLSFNLKKMMSASPDAFWHPEDQSALWNGDYFYDHAEPSQNPAPLVQRYAWRARTSCPNAVGENSPATNDGTVQSQFGAMVHAATHINQGRTPFRPKVATDPPKLQGRTTTPRRGGNTIFFNLDALAAHTYPAMRAGARWSRRADMIGATLLANRTGLTFRKSTLTLHHNRTGQRNISASTTDWLDEFQGVLLARLTMDTITTKPTLSVGHYAERRAQRILEALCAAHQHLQSSLQVLENPKAWWAFTQDRRDVMELLKSLQSLQIMLNELDQSQLRKRMLDPSMHNNIAQHFRSMRTRDTWMHEHTSRGGAQ